jgi:hypothetical protein
VIAALIAILFLGGGIDNSVMDFVGYMRDSVDEVVVDEQRLAEARTTLKAMKKLTGAHSKANQKAFKSLLAELSESETNAEAVEALWENYYESVESYNEQMIDLRFELRDSLTRDEWQQIFGDADG